MAVMQRKLKNVWLTTSGIARFVLVNVLELLWDIEANDLKLIEILEKYGKCIVFTNEKRKFYLVDWNLATYKGKVGIYVVTHKAFLSPEDAMYIPIHVEKKEKGSWISGRWSGW